MTRLKGKTALVTGASKGIGADIAKKLAAAGASVVVNYSSSKEGADKVVSEITKNGGKAIAVQADVSKSEDIKRLLTETKKAYGQLDILVNNAGIFQFDPLENVTEKEFHREFNINVLGLILTTQEAVKYFNGNGGSIINISSIASQSALANSVVYSATKGAIDTVTKVLSKELAPKKIRVNSINPGGVETEGTHRIGIIGSDIEKWMVEHTPLGRLGQPEDISPVAVFLASDDSAWITGEIIRVAGGAQ